MKGFSERVFNPLAARLCRVAAVILLIGVLTGCGAGTASPETTEPAAVAGKFDFPLPQGYVMENVTDRDCSIVDTNGTAVGGITLTDLEEGDLTEEFGNGVILYLESIAEGSEYFAWKGEDEDSPVLYMTHYAPVPDSQEKKTYKRVLFVRDGGVYDLWLDLDRIDEELVDSFYPAVDSTAGETTAAPTGETVPFLDSLELTMPEDLTWQRESDTRVYFCQEDQVVGGIAVLDIADQMQTMSLEEYAGQAKAVTQEVYNADYDYMASGSVTCQTEVSLVSREGREFYHYFFQGEEMGYDVWMDSGVLDGRDMRSYLKTLHAPDLYNPQDDIVVNAETPLLNLWTEMPQGITRQPKRTDRELFYQGETLAGGIEQVTGERDPEALTALALSLSQELYEEEFTQDAEEGTDGTILWVIRAESQNHSLVHCVIQVDQEVYDVWTDTALIPEESALAIAQSCQY